METPVEKAKNTPRKKYKHEITEEQIDLALAWMKGEVGGVQCQVALKGVTRQDWYSKASILLREAYYRGYLEIKKGDRQ